MDKSDHDAAALLREYVLTGHLLQIATVSPEGHPWMAHVWYAADDSLNLYFTSNVARRHSADIRSNSKVAGGIVAVPLEGLGQKVRGVTFEGIAQECNIHQGDNDVKDAYRTYESRWPTISTVVAPLQRILNEESPMRMYKIAPTSYVLFDEVNFPPPSENPRRELAEW